MNVAAICFIFHSIYQMWLVRYYVDSLSYWLVVYAFVMSGIALLFSLPCFINDSLYETKKLFYLCHFYQLFNGNSF